MTRLSAYTRTRITLLHEQLFKINQIVRILESEDVHTTRQTVAKFIRKHKYGNDVTTRKRIGRKPKLNREHFDFIDHQLEENDELCAVGKCINYSVVNTTLLTSVV